MVSMAFLMDKYKSFILKNYLFLINYYNKYIINITIINHYRHFQYGLFLNRYELCIQDFKNGYTNMENSIFL